MFLVGESMKIDMERIRLSGRESWEFIFKSSGSNEYFQDIGGKYQEKLKVNLRVDKAGKHFLARGRIITVLELQCSRCLEKFIYPVDVDFNVYLVDSEHQEEFCREDEVLFYSNDELDIKPYVEETVLADIPLIPLCNTQCEGLCSECGHNLNISKCSCRHDYVDPRWEKLKEFKAGKEVT